jgi:esterase/lipase superfamily enzyme
MSLVVLSSSRKTLPCLLRNRTFACNFGLAMLVGVCAMLAGCVTRPSGALIADTRALSGTAGGEVVDMLVATTRQPSPVPGVLFSGERGELAFSEVAVSIPPDNARKVGEIQWPSSLPANPATDFTTVKVESVSVPQGVRDWAKRSLAHDRHVLVFVHGFNTNYDEAVYRFAQIVHDSKAAVTPVLFTWPSRGDVFQYPYDRESTNYSRSAFEDMLWRISQDPSVGRISILAHSMGTWLTVEGLRQLAIRHRQVPPKIREVMLAAADLDVDVLGQQMQDIGKPRPDFILFVSRDDKALDFSRTLAGDVDRLGQVDPTKEPYRSILERQHGITVVDLSAVRTGDDIDHSKFAQSPQAIQLIGRQLAGQQIAPDKGIAGNIGASVVSVTSAPVAIVQSATR